MLILSGAFPINLYKILDLEKLSAWQMDIMVSKEKIEEGEVTEKPLANKFHMEFEQ